MISWLKGLLNAFSKTPKVPESMDEAKVDNQVGQTKQPDGRKVPARKSNQGIKSPRVRSDNKSQTVRKRTGAAVRAAATKGKAKSKTVQKG